MQEIMISADMEGQRFDKFLKKLLPSAGNGLIYKQLRKKNITLNHKKAEGSELLKEGDVVCFFFSDETFQKFRGMKEEDNASEPDASLSEYLDVYEAFKNVKIIFENQDILIADKPIGILTQKAKRDDRSLNEWLIGYLLKEGAVTKESLKLFRPSVCNRLDRNTSGVLLCGKTLAGSQALSECLRRRLLTKHYLGICHGRMLQSGTFDGFLSKDEGRNLVSVKPASHAASREMTSRETDSGEGAGDYICTRYQALCFSETHTLLQAELITGKSHQIRAQLASLGHPLMGDGKYAPNDLLEADRSQFHVRSQLLHAWQVVFPAPDTVLELPERFQKVLLPIAGKSFEAPGPKDFRRVSELLFPDCDMTMYK